MASTCNRTQARCSNHTQQACLCDTFSIFLSIITGKHKYFRASPTRFTRLGKRGMAWLGAELNSICRYLYAFQDSASNLLSVSIRILLSCFGQFSTEARTDCLLCSLWHPSHAQRASHAVQEQTTHCVISAAGFGLFHQPCVRDLRQGDERAREIEFSWIS